MTETDVEPRVVADYACETGENPLWHPLHERLYWTDIPHGRLYYYEPGSNRHAECYRGRPVGGFTIQADGQLLLFRDRGNIVSYDAQHQRQTCTIVDEIPDLTETRFNDVIADPEGRVFAGTMSFGERRNGRLYRLERDGRVELVSDGHATPNGMGFSPDLSTFYFTDSRLRRIYAFDYDRVDAALENQRIVSEVDIEDVERIGRSDGMTVDADGFIWSARIGAGCVLQLEPDGRLAARHDLPTKRVTSLAFGGADLCELFVTSAGGNDKAKHGSYAGALFSLKPGAKGRVEFLSSIG